MSNMPVDVLGEIFCRLPVDCTLRFRCACKFWRSPLDSYEFVKLHLKHSMKTNSNRWLILRETKRLGYESNCFYRLDIDSLNSSAVAPKYLINPLPSSKFKTAILGSCNGLLLISNTLNDLVLWNPSTGKSKKLPALGFGAIRSVKFGLGFDILHSDYRVVRIVQLFDSGNVRSDFRIYSLSSDSWKTVNHFPHSLLCHDLRGTYLEGALHWVGNTQIGMTTDNLKPMIVAFDLGSETCRILQHPPHTDGYFNINLEMLGGCLGAFQSYFVGSQNEWGFADFVLDHVDVWIMKSYGDDQSWTFILSLEEAQKCIGHSIVPIVFSKSGDEVLVERDHMRLLWTSCKDGNVKPVDIGMSTEAGMFRGVSHFNSFFLLGSLVQLSSDEINNLKKQNHDKGGKTKSLKKRGDDFLSAGFK